MPSSYGLAGRLRAWRRFRPHSAMVETLTTPFRARHPEVQFTILSRTSIEILTHLENLEIDAGLTYLDNEPLGRVTAMPSIASATGCSSLPTHHLAIAKRVTWTEVAQVPLCLLTPDMQNRRIIERLLRDTGIEPTDLSRVRSR